MRSIVCPEYAAFLEVADVSKRSAEGPHNPDYRRRHWPGPFDGLTVRRVGREFISRRSPGRASEKDRRRNSRSRRTRRIFPRRHSKLRHSGKDNRGGRKRIRQRGHAGKQRRRQLHCPYRKTLAQRIQRGSGHRSSRYIFLHACVGQEMDRSQAARNNSEHCRNLCLCQLRLGIRRPFGLRKSRRAGAHSLAVEWARHHIRLNAIAPGPFPTEGAWSRLLPSKDLEERARNYHPMKRFGRHEELANIAAYLLSEQATYVNGECVVIDGGLWLRGAGEFNDFVDLPETAWDMLENARKSKG